MVMMCLKSKFWHIHPQPLLYTLSISHSRRVVLIPFNSFGSGNLCNWDSIQVSNAASNNASAFLIRRETVG